MPPQVTEQILQSTLATWLFINPTALDAFKKWLEKMGKSRGLLRDEDGEQPKFYLTIDQMTAAAADPDIKDHVVLIQQRAGDQVYVPPGYPHYVINHLPCVKVAYDTIELDHLPKYVVANQTVNTRIAPNATDYVDVAKVTLSLCIWAAAKITDTFLMKISTAQPDA